MNIKELKIPKPKSWTGVADLSAKYTIDPDFRTKPKINNSRHAVEMFTKLFDPDTIAYKESMYALYLNRSNLVLAHHLLSEGGQSGTVVDPKMLFGMALLVGAHGIIICHNHPSGTLKPSEQDMKLVKQLQEAGKVMEIQLLDSVIIVPEKYPTSGLHNIECYQFFSWADEGLL